MLKREISLKIQKVINEGNRAAREGDPPGDALSFKYDHRTDRRTYRELYGLDYQQVLNFRTYMNGLFNTP